MVFERILTSRDPSNIPDPDPGTIGLEIADTNSTLSAVDKSAAMAERTFRPQPPPKRAHIEEILRLKKELEDTRVEKEEAEEMTMNMCQDLQLAQEETEKKTVELSRREADHRKCEEELQHWRQKAQRLSVEISEERRMVAAMKQSLETQDAVVSSPTNNQLGNEEELSKLRKQVVQLTATLSVKDNHMNSVNENEARLEAQLAQEQELRRVAETTLQATKQKMTSTSSREQELRHAAESSLRIAKEEYEIKSREADERTVLQIAEMQKRAQDAEASLQEHTKEVGGDREQLLQHIHSLESELQDQRKSHDFFKKNSERLSREIRDIQAARKALEQSEHAATRQVADLKSQVAALQSRRSMPGTY